MTEKVAVPFHLFGNTSSAFRDGLGFGYRFLNAFFRFTSRRGVPKEVISDRGSNFVGAVGELKKLVSQLDRQQLQSKAAELRVTWRFNPPSAPHFGGAHEVMVKAAKKAIYAIVSDRDVTDEELITVFAGAESLLNSRPLTYQSSDPRDDVPLTPNHFLHGQTGDSSRLSLLKPQLFTHVNDGERFKISFHECGGDGSKNVFLP